MNEFFIINLVDFYMGLVMGWSLPNSFIQVVILEREKPCLMAK